MIHRLVRRSARTGQFNLYNEVNRGHFPQASNHNVIWHRTLDVLERTDYSVPHLVGYG
ncbi:hypothetical protein [Paenibacillus sp. 1781tsa1]|uniref:hypothetical protein n=1 Tax=Paenibacillus sp. 1781tsa1 TaxID=2953810 RepID=UPI00209D1E0E|nr:hypothetical protein [Paenibacillus sp. 1781tsa1]MCP1181550.1 hypothetical protein [Paenibacillus sp. 1781tsa1]